MQPGSWLPDVDFEISGIASKMPISLGVLASVVGEIWSVAALANSSMLFQCSDGRGQLLLDGRLRWVFSAVICSSVSCPQGLSRKTIDDLLFESARPLLLLSKATVQTPQALLD